MQSIKEHNLKANHNGWTISKWSRSSVCNLSKNTIWKQITTKGLETTRIDSLYAIYQRTQSESKSQHRWHKKILLWSVCNLSKNTIWKQITTGWVGMFPESTLHAIYQRTQSESKSQLMLPPKFPLPSVCNLSKNTIWKQITTKNCS